MIGLLAHLMQTSIDSTNKFSFKGAGTVYRKRYSTDNEINLSESLNEIVKEARNFSSTNGTLSRSKEKQAFNETYINKTLLDEKIENKLIEPEKSRDFRVLSSFECNGSIPSAFTSYVSNTFVSEYGKSFGDFASDNAYESMPQLNNVQISCTLGLPCHTYFEYDKQRGLNSTSDKKYLRENIFYCCPPVDYFNNVTVAECNDSKTIIEKSTFRESKKPFLLERLNSKYKFDVSHYFQEL